MDLGLNGRHALVTGASKGIGYGIARELAREGASVCLVARSADDLAAAASRLREETGMRIDVLAIDLSAPGAADRVVAAQPAIDILVNNAGDIPGGTLEEVDEATWRRGWDLKVFGTINLTRAYLPRMRMCKGVVLNIIGIAGEMVDAAYIAGSCGNAALVTFTKALGSTSIESGVRVVGINPGPVMTDRQMRILRKRAGGRLGDAERWPELEAKMPGGRSATVDEIAATAALLCSPRSSYTSGAVFNIDGGISQRHSIA
jgi:NAD(P)-dependent dehydrogenase (short-subunit alcohol dehydrogenase family)